jgi:hypothetical protein
MIKIDKPVYKIDAIEDLIPLISKLYSIPPKAAREWVVDYMQFDGRRNGHVVVDEDISKGEFGQYEEWVKDCAPPNKDFIDGDVGAILCDAANHDLIPEGCYIVTFNW